MGMYLAEKDQKLLRQAALDKKIQVPMCLSRTQRGGGGGLPTQSHGAAQAWRSEDHAAVGGRVEPRGTPLRSEDVLHMSVPRSATIGPPQLRGHLCSQRDTEWWWKRSNGRGPAPPPPSPRGPSAASRWSTIGLYMDVAFGGLAPPPPPVQRQPLDLLCGNVCRGGTDSLTDVH